jgi:hypothetical protein
LKKSIAARIPNRLTDDHVNYIASQLVPEAKILPPEAEHVCITEGPTIKSAKRNLIIIKWTSNNPGGTDEHFGIVHYGTDPGRLSQTAQSPGSRLSSTGSIEMRVQVKGLDDHRVI